MVDSTDNYSPLTRVVAFYSYKGGVGRTLALANCARYLAMQGKKIVLMDFDLEAPGLQHFDVLLPKKNSQRPHAGFAEYIETCLQRGIPDKLDEFIYPCKGMGGDKGKLWLMPAGRHREPGYMEFLNRMTWSEFYSLQEGYKILENLRGHIINQYQPDYIFIDSRTGRSEIAGIATHQLADIVALVFNLNQQNLLGAEQIYQSISKSPLSPKVIITASPIPVVPMEKGTPFAGKMKFIKKHFSGAVNSEQPIVIPYHPLLAFEERLLVDSADLFSTNQPYIKLAELIQKTAEVDEDYYLQLMTEPLKKGDWNQVKNIALQGLTKTPNNSELLENLYRAYYFLNETDKSLSSLNRLIKISQKAKIDNISFARLLFDKSIILGELDRSEEEVEVYNQLIAQFSGDAEPTMEERIARVLFNKGVRLGELGRSEEAIEVYTQLIDQFGENSESAIQEQVAKAFVNKGVRLGQLNRSEEAIGVYNQLIAQFVEQHEPVIQEQVAKAFANKGVRLGELDHLEEEIKVYNQLIDQFGENSEPAIQEIVAQVLFNKGVSLRQLDRLEEAIEVYNQLIEQFGEHSEPAMIQEIVARVLFNKGVSLKQLDRSEEAIEVYNHLIDHFGEHFEPVIQEQVAYALNGKGYHLLINAKANYGRDEFIPLLNEALALFDTALEKVNIEEVRAMILGNKSYSLFLLDRGTESEELMTQALQLGGESLYQATLDDIKITPVTEDKEFKKMLDNIWTESPAGNL